MTAGPLQVPPELDQVPEPSQAPPELGQLDLGLEEWLDLGLQEVDWRRGVAGASLLVAMSEYDPARDPGEERSAMSRQRARMYQALNRWDVMAPLLKHVRATAVGAARLLRGTETVKRFKFSPAARAFLEEAIARAPRRLGEPTNMKPRTREAMFDFLELVAGCYQQRGRAFTATHDNLTKLVEDWTTRTGERWLPILHRALILDVYEGFDEHEAPRKSKEGAEYDRSQAPNLYLVDQTLLLHTAIRLTLDKGAAVRASVAAVASTTAMASPTDPPSNVSSRGGSSVPEGPAIAGPEDRASVGAAPAAPEEDSGRARAASTALILATASALTPATPATGYEEKGSRAPLEVGSVGERSTVEQRADFRAYDRVVWGEQFRKKCGAPPPTEKPAEVGQLGLFADRLLAGERVEAAAAAVATDEERWRGAVRTLLAARQVVVPDEMAPLVEERLAHHYAIGDLPDAAVDELQEMTLRRRPVRVRAAPPEELAPPAQVATGPPSMNAN